MNIGNVQSGDTLICCHCGHERVVDDAWLQSVCAKFFHDRKPPRIYDSDLAKFRCSICKNRKLLKRSAVGLSIAKSNKTKVPGVHLATTYIEQASPKERLVLLNWAQQMLEIRESNDSALNKAKHAILLTIQSGAILPFLTFLGGEIKRVGWDERGLPERLALGAAATTALVFSGQGAGIAALGGAIGVPLWVVFGAGGAFAGVIIEEIKRRNK